MGCSIEFVAPRWKRPARGARAGYTRTVSLPAPFPEYIALHSPPWLSVSRETLTAEQRYRTASLITLGIPIALPVSTLCELVGPRNEYGVTRHAAGRRISNKKGIAGILSTLQ